jgi:hypothetical protein
LGICVCWRKREKKKTRCETRDGKHLILSFDVPGAWNCAQRNVRMNEQLADFIIISNETYHAWYQITSTPWYVGGKKKHNCWQHISPNQLILPSDFLFIFFISLI